MRDKREKLTCGPNKGEQKVEAKEGEVGGSLGLGNEVQEADVGKQGERK